MDDIITKNITKNPFIKLREISKAAERLCSSDCSSDLISAEEFLLRTNVLVKKLKDNSSLAPFLNEEYFPVFLPKIKAEGIGEATEEIFTFANRVAGDKIINRVGIAYNCFKITHYEALLSRLYTGNMVAIVFPSIFKKFSPDNQVEIIEKINNPCLIPQGPLEVSMAFSMYPDLFNQQHEYDLPALRISDSNNRMKFPLFMKFYEEYNSYSLTIKLSHYGLMLGGATFIEDGRLIE